MTAERRMRRADRAPAEDLPPAGQEIAASDGGLRRAVALLSATSILTPVIGVVTAPVLTHGLGVLGRGGLSVASAPNVLLVGAAALGLPEALTFFSARVPASALRLLRRSIAPAVAFGVVGLLVVALLAPVLTDHQPDLTRLVVLGAVLAVPALLLALVRGVAAGMQMWGAIAAERVIASVARLVLLVSLYATHELTVLTALLTTVAGPLFGAVAYWRLTRVVRLRIAEDTAARTPPTIPHFTGYGLRTWFGSVAGLITSRLCQILFAPLSSVGELGLYVVAVTISDVPLITALAIKDALFGVNSKERNADQLATTSRLTLLVAVIGGLVIGATLPLWIQPVFGRGFQAAIVPTEVLLLSAAVNVPNFLVAAGLGAWGRPGLRSIGLVGITVVQLVAFVLLVHIGATGGALAALIASLLGTAYMVIAAAAVLERPVRVFLVPQRGDLRQVAGAVAGAARGLRARLRRDDASGDQRGDERADDREGHR